MNHDHTRSTCETAVVFENKHGQTKKKGRLRPISDFPSLYKEAAPKSSVYGGVKTFSNKKGLVGRMTMIQSALDSSDLGEYFRYPQRHEKVYRKFFRDV